MGVDLQVLVGALDALHERRQGIVVTKVKKRRYARGRRIKEKDIALFTRQLSTMITSGLPLVQSLDILGNQIEDVNFRGIVKDIKERIEGGSRFADALREYPQCFDELYINLVVAGEEGGLLDNVLQRLAIYIEKSEKLKKKVKGAMIYPVAIIVVAMVVVVVLLLFVIPVFNKAGFASLNHCQFVLTGILHKTKSRCDIPWYWFNKQRINLLTGQPAGC